MKSLRENIQIKTIYATNRVFYGNPLLNLKNMYARYYIRPCRGHFCPFFSDLNGLNNLATW